MCVLYSLVLVLLDHLVYADFQGDVLVAGVAAVLVDAELGRGDRLSIGYLSEVKAKLFVVSPLGGKILISLH